MENRIWLLTALVGMALIYESTAINCMSCKDTETENACGLGTGSVVPCEAGDKCYMRNNGGKIERGCVNQLSPPDANCVAEEGQSCMTCTTESCNNVPWVKCHKCEPTDATCANVQETTGATFCSKFAKEDQCYAKVDGTDGTQVTRGCKTDLPRPTDGCTGNKYCDLCYGDACNSLSGAQLATFPNCLTCTSDQAECVTGTFTAGECDKRDDVCFTRLAANKLERGCLSALPSADQGKCTDDKDATCLTCTNPAGCNKQTWLQCHQCKETDVETTCAALQADTNAQFCKTYKEGDHCYVRLESDKSVRGCESDLANNEDSCKDNLACLRCAEDKCNKQTGDSLKSDERCLQCTTNADVDGTCLSGKAAAHPCANPSDKKCYAKIDANGVLRRGCQGDLTADEIKACTGTTCGICEAGKCAEIFPTDRLRCYQCSSDSDKTCSDQLTGDSKSNYCKLYKADDKCYSRIVNKVFERGCQSNLEKAACDGLGERECTACSGANCNQISEERLKNSAGQMAISSILIAFAMALNYFYF